MQYLIRVALVFLAGAWVTSCHSMREYSYLANETQNYRDKKITSVVTKRGDVIYYDLAGARYIVDVKDTTLQRKVIGFNIENKPLSIPVDDILEISCESREVNGPGTGLTILATAGVLLLAIMALSFSPH